MVVIPGGYSPDHLVGRPGGRRRHLITSRNPDDIPAFVSAILDRL